MNGTEVERALAYMLAQVGKPYVWGGIGPRGYDCSGLGYSGYKAGGLSIPRATGGQAYAGTAVHGDIASLLPGDAIFPHPGHVVYYLGGGRVVEAPHSGLNVRVTDIPSKIWKVRRFATAPQTAWTTQTLKAGFGVGDVLGLLNPGVIGDAAGMIGDDIANIPGVKGTAGIIGDSIDATQALVKLAGFIVDPHNWYRVGLFVLGAAFLFIAFRAVASGPIKSALGKAVPV